MTPTRLATVSFVLTLCIAAPSYAQRGERRHGPGGGDGHGRQAQPRGGGPGAQPQAQRESRGRESRQQPAQQQVRGSRQQPQIRSYQQPQVRTQQQPQIRTDRQPQIQERARGWGRPQAQAQAQPRGSYRQPVEPRTGYSQQIAPPSYRQQPELRARPRADVQAYGRDNNRSYDNRYKDNRSQGYRDRYNGGYRPYDHRSYAIPYGYRPHGYRPGWSFNLYFGRPYGYYGEGAAYGYYAMAPGFVYGSVRIVDAPPDAQVFVDGYYAGVVDDYDGVFQHLNLVPGPHRIEIQLADYAPIGVDVFVQAGQTIVYRAGFY
jgi:hypothetical protein